MRRSPRRAASVGLAVALSGLLAGCGGGGFGLDRPTPPDRTVRSYVALGDQFTAAPGAGRTVGDDGCRRSDANYPALVAEKLGVDDVRDVSCSGATTASLTTESKPRKGASVPAQLDAVDRDTDLVTIGIGIADRDLLRHVFEVCTALPCGQKVTPQTVLTDVGAMSDALTTAIRSVQEQAPNAYIVVVGYPRMTPDDGTCDALPDLGERGLDGAKFVLDAINREVVTAARATGAGYVDAARISTGHDLCSDEPWVRKRKGGRPTDLVPVAAEQRAIADAVVTLVKTQ